MSIFGRLARLIKSNINDLISRSEDPEKMLHQIIIDMNNQLLEAKKQVATSIADEKRLAKQVDAERAKANEWEKRAMMAVRAGDDNLAREALARKAEHDGIVEQYRLQWQKQKQAVDQLKLALRALNGKIEEAKRKKSLLIARKKRAEAQKAIQETLSGLKNASAFEAFDRMEGRIHQMEAEAEAAAELQEEATGDVLALKFKDLEVSHGSEEDLIALKRKMGLLPPESAPPAEAVRVDSGASAESEFDALDPAEQAELERALAELEAEENRQLSGKR
jgi:phage shock protein A